MKTPHPNQDALNLKKEAEKLMKRADKIYGQAYEKINQMEEICIHDETEKKYDYIPGGYLDRCEYINRIVCTVCGKVLDEQKTYGGFN